MPEIKGIEVVKATPVKPFHVDRRDSPPAGKKEAPPEPQPKDGDDKPAELDITKGLDILRKRLGFHKDEKKEPPKEEPKEEPKEAPKEEPKKEDTPKEAPKDEPKKKDEPKEERGNLDMVETVARSAAEAAVKAAESSRPKAREDAPSEPDLSAEDQADYAVLLRMEKDSPVKYKGLSKKFIKYVNDLSRYREDWQRANPDKEFEAASDDHASFFDRNEPKYDRREFDDTRINIRVEAKLKERESQSEERFARLEREQAEHRIAPVIEKRLVAGVDGLIKAADETVYNLYAEKGADAVKEQDPIAFEVLDRAAGYLRHILPEIERLADPRHFSYDPNNRAHAEINDFALGLEADIKSRSADARTKGGRMFATSEEMAGTPEHLRSRYWALDWDMIREEFVKDLASKAKKMIEDDREKINRYLKIRGIDPSKAPEKKAEAIPPKAAEPKAERTRSPSTPGDRSGSTGGPLHSTESSPAVKAFTDKLWQT